MTPEYKNGKNLGKLMFIYLFQEMQNMNSFMNPKQNMPEMSELLTSWLGGGQSTKKAIKPKTTKTNRRT